jgi:hypothetical protein
VAHAFKVLERALPLLDPDGPCERREIVVETALRHGFVTDEFIDLARTTDRTAVQEARLDALRLAMAERVLSRLAADVYDVDR